MINDLSSIWQRPDVPIFAILIGLDFITGVASAIAGKSPPFDPQQVARFLWTNVGPYVLIYGFLVVSIGSLPDSGTKQALLVVQDAAFVAIVVNLVTSINSNLNELGISPIKLGTLKLGPVAAQGSATPAPEH